MDLKRIAARRKALQAGFSLIEGMIALGMMGAAALVYSGVSTEIARTTRRGQDLSQLVVEQSLVSQMLQALPTSAIQLAIESGHPWGYVDSAGNVSNMPATIAPADEQALAELADAVFAWPGASRMTAAGGGNGVLITTGPAAANIVSKLTQAGCVSCHNGAPYSSTASGTVSVNMPSGAVEFSSNFAYSVMEARGLHTPDFNFGNLSNLVNTPYNGAPLATMGILSSRLGARVLRRQFAVKDASSGSQRTTDWVTFSTDSIASNTPVYTKVARVSAPIANPNPCGVIAPAGDANCFAGDNYLSASCVSRCAQVGAQPMCSCGKNCSYPCGSPPCTQWIADYYCWSTIDGQQKTFVPPASPVSGFDVGGNIVGDLAPAGAWAVEPNVCGNWCPGDETGIPPMGWNGNKPQCSRAQLLALPPDQYCVNQGSCMRTCDVPVMVPGPPCGKDCTPPPVQVACLQQRYTFTCSRKIPVQSTSIKIYKFSIDSTFTDSVTGQVRGSNMTGVVQ